MILRAAARGDSDAIAAIWNAMIRDTPFTFTTEEKTAEGIAALIATRPGAFWVAEERALSGFVTYAQFRSGPGYAASVEHSIVLADGAQGRGVGRALMLRAFESAARQGHHVMVAGISAANPVGVAFHTALGFENVGRMPQVGLKAGQWLDLILMQKMLEAG